VVGVSRRRTVGLAESRRARVPFAVLGVLLLVGSVAVSIATHDRERIGATADGRASAERAVAAGDTALRSAVRAASAAAARNPVTDPAATPAGGVLNESSPFGDALRLRIYLAARERFAAIDERVGNARTTLSLPATETPAAQRAAKRRVDLQRIDGGLRVTVDGVRVETDRNGRTVESDVRSLSVAVETPVLALHDAVEQFDRRLDRGPTEGRGLGQRVTGWLYALAWGRGYAQYGGAPIRNVLGTRHLALATNAGALAVQRSVFGAADADGLAAKRRATVRVGTQDLLATSNYPTGWANQILRGDSSGGSPTLTAPETAAPGPDDLLSVEVGATADVAFRAFLEEYEGVLEGGYRTEARLSTNVTVLDREPPTAVVPPGGGWERVAVERSETRAVAGGSGDPAAIPYDHDRYAGYVRQVRTIHTRRVTWERGNETRTTTTNRSVIHRVAMSVSGRPDPDDDLADLPIDPVYETGGPLLGPNLRGIPDRAVERLIDDSGGLDRIARQTVADGPDAVTVTLHGRRPERLDAWVYADLMAFREEIRSLSTSVRRGTIGTGSNVPAQLAAEIRDRRVSLLAAPAVYDGVAERTRIAARDAYLDAVLARLDEEAAASERTQSQLRELLAERDLVPGGSIEALLDARGGDVPEPRPTIDTFDGRVGVTVDGAPPYLTAVGVEGRTVPGVRGEYHGLTTRNRNLFSLPYGETADAIVGAFVDDTSRVSLGPAARTLRATNRTSDRTGDDALGDRRRELVEAVGDTMDVIVDRTAGKLSGRTTLNETAARRIVEAGLGTYPTLDARATAVANGSAATPIGTAAVDRLDPETIRGRDRIRLLVRESLRGALEASVARPEQSPVERAGARTRRIARSELSSVIRDRLASYSETYRERLFGDGPGAVPSGLPVTPVPWLWYATVNVWTVDVRGEYARFAVTAPTGGPDTSGGEITYVRDGETVQFDVDGDGQAERVGQSERVGFDLETAVVVAVPPGGRGVGDSGDAVETSEGWPCPGLARTECDRDNSPTHRREGMFHEQRRDVDGLDPADLRAEYDAELAGVVESVGVDAAVEASGVDRATVEALGADEQPHLSLPAAAAIAALDEDAPDADTVVEIACEHLLLGMSTAVMDVDALAAAVELDLDPKEIQQKLERRAPMSFDEFVHLQHAIAREQP